MPRDPWLPRVVSMACFPTAPSGACDWHTHDHDELCLVDGDRCRIGHGGSPRDAAPPTLYLFRRGERHGYWNDARQRPHLWVIHFDADQALERECPLHVAPDPARRVLALTQEQAAEAKALFLRVLGEHRRRGPGAAAAESAWLRLLLIAAQRWTAPVASVPSAPDRIDDELLALWQVVNDHADRPAQLARALRRRVANYDSLRHRFRKAFGESPRGMIAGLRMERAKSLLLETPLSIKAIAERVGYGRQHEFARAFRRHVGCTPSRWRVAPTARP